MLIDNKNNAKIGDKLRESIQHDSKLSVISGLFSIYAYDALKTELEKIDSVRLLLSRTKANIDSNDHLNISLTGDDNETRLRNKLNQSKIARECASWIASKSQVNITQRSGVVSQTLYHVAGDSSNLAIQGSSHFTTAGLGYTESSSFDMNMGFTDTENTFALLSWFDSIWNNQVAVQEAKGLLQQQLELLFKDQPPQFIYFLTLLNIFKDFIEQIDEEKIIRSKTGFKNTLVWNKLYKFQRDGVLGAIDKIERYNGCIIADSVGLGKTFEALAIIKYYELRNDRVLVLCPKKLRDNWTLFTVNDKRNLFADDRFNYDVLNHTDLTREDGKSGEINLESINWGNYDLIVIDESHNFRNNNPRKDGKTRYSKLMQDVIRSGVKTKVLMLSATPVNNRMNDLKNQVSFITEGKDDALADHGIHSVEQTLKQAQSRFNQWVKQDPKTRTVAVLMDSMNFDYFKLLDILTIARSRKHIEKYYGTADIGKFPERLKPQNIKADIDTQNQYPALFEVNRMIRKLHLSAYSPIKYVRMEKREEYNRKYDMAVKDGKGGVFKQADREQSLIHLMRINLLKRMESSIHSFGQTVESLLNTVSNLLTVIEQHQVSEIETLSIEDIDLDAPELESLLIGNKIKVLVQDMDLVLWKQDLQEDLYQLQHLLADSNLIDANRDAKLQDLKMVIQNKVNNPINDGNKKLIIFTAFADTANYLYQHLACWAHHELGIHSALVTGSGTNKCTLKGIGSDLGAILTNFSPISKERSKIDESASTEIDLLIATDCISEGQNLQDCDALINYDIHWNPVRIIQRFGRIDRLGSQNSKIQLINFWPNMALDEYINLEARVSGRMVLLDISATGEENVIEQDETNRMNDLEYRRKQLEQLQEAVVDLEDIAGGVSITDLTLNDFRMDLSAYMQSYIKELELAPSQGYIDAHGKVQDALKTALKNNTVSLPESVQDQAADILSVLKKIAGGLNIKNNADKRPIKLNKQVFIGEDFKALWDKIKFKTVYRVDFDSAKLVEQCAAEIKKNLIVGKPKFTYTKAKVDITEAGVTGIEQTTQQYSANLHGYALPDVVGYLQEETNLTRRSIVDILIKSGRLESFKSNPQKFIEQATAIIRMQMRLFITDGIKYRKIGDDQFFAQELFETEELMGYLNKNMLEAKKSVYDHVVYDSDVEQQFAASCEKNTDIKVYAKLPSWFKIDTPLGTYNPDWAILVNKDDQEKLYFVVETKGTLFASELRPVEQAKIDCGAKHFEALGQDVHFAKADSFDSFSSLIE